MISWKKFSALILENNGYPQLKRILALDVGDKTIGVALSDALGITAQGLFTYERISLKRDTTAIIELIDEHDVSSVVIGLPINLDGTDSVQTEKVREFTEKLGNKLRSTGRSDVGIIMHDERFTTKIAASVMIEAGMRREKRKEIIDRQAAVVILQSYLESQRSLKTSLNEV
jgi:putative Holliday junction resolvase